MDARPQLKRARSSTMLTADVTQAETRVNQKNSKWAKLINAHQQQDVTDVTGKADGSDNMKTDMRHNMTLKDKGAQTGPTHPSMFRSRNLNDSPPEANHRIDVQDLTVTENVSDAESTASSDSSTTLPLPGKSPETL